MLTLRGILFICLHKGRNCTYLDIKMILNFKKSHSTIPVFHHSNSPFHCLYTLQRECLQPECHTSENAYYRQCIGHLCPYKTKFGFIRTFCSGA